MNVFEVLTTEGQLETSIVLDAIDFIKRTTDGKGTQVVMRSGSICNLVNIPIESLAKALRDAQPLPAIDYRKP